MIDPSSSNPGLPNSWHERLAQLQTTFLQTVQNHMQALTQTMGETLSTWKEDLQAVQQGLSRLQSLDQERQVILNDITARLTRLQTVLPAAAVASSTVTAPPQAPMTGFAGVTNPTAAMSGSQPSPYAGAPEPVPEMAAPLVTPEPAPSADLYDTPYASSFQAAMNPLDPYGTPDPVATVQTPPPTAPKAPEPDTVLPKLIQSF